MCVRIPMIVLVYFIVAPLLAATLGTQPCLVGTETRSAVTQISNRGTCALVAWEEPQPCSEAVPLVIGAVAPVAARRRWRIVVYARYSTEEQNPRSTDDQLTKCRQFADSLGLADVEIIKLSDAAASGEHAHRPGIDRVWEMIESAGCDVIVAEDISRFYRHSTRAMQFIEAAVDAGIRVIAINSHVDTADSEGRWRMGSYFASMKVEMDNAETRQRIIRAMESLWRYGFAVGALEPGYLRVPSTPATEREPARGPFRDEKDARWTPVIRTAYEMCAHRDPPW